ncbi:membrane-spanning 4-domains subfamily A member 4A-like [Erpetoichthys calabaricus]|uniref:Membrane-spanning 4-domains subfamily A member 4A-like n=1 Tax=Erpetoichthys calabaricus TaxID=27687 RepID=A0A8C4SSZ6_ERPCA|nr:membrane-spanning 4-domains subfamily A member 4A-like [Erpetoichthys calabaricus]
MEKGITVIVPMATKATQDYTTYPSATASHGSDSITKVQLPQVLNKFRKGEPCILGILQLTSAIVNILFGVIMAMYLDALTFTGIPFWTGILYIISGSLSIAADKKPKTSLMNAMLTMNIISSIAAGIGIIFYATNLSFRIYISYCFYHLESDYVSPSSCEILHEKHTILHNGTIGLMLVFTILEFFVTIITSSFGCKVICGQNLPVIIVQQTIHSNTDPAPNV